MSDLIDLKGLDKAEVLAKLYNASKPLGLGFLHYKSDEMSIEEARQLLKERTYFDYINGRVMKINLKGDKLDPHLYDRDNGKNAAANALKKGKKC